MSFHFSNKDFAFSWWSTGDQRLFQETVHHGKYFSAQFQFSLCLLQPSAAYSPHLLCVCSILETTLQDDLNSSNFISNQKKIPFLIGKFSSLFSDRHLRHHIACFARSFCLHFLSRTGYCPGSQMGGSRQTDPWFSNLWEVEEIARLKLCPWISLLAGYSNGVLLSFALFLYIPFM